MALVNPRKRNVFLFTSFSSPPAFMENFSGISFPFHRRRGELRELNLLAAKPVILSDAFLRQGY